MWRVSNAAFGQERDPSGGLAPITDAHSVDETTYRILLTRLGIVLAVPWGIEGHEVSGMKFQAPLVVISLGLDG